MITIKTNDLKNVIEIEVEGKITSDDIEEFENYFITKKEKYGEINLLMSISVMSYTLDGLIRDLQFETKHWNKFNKIAVISDKTWVDIGTKMIDLLPKVIIRQFDVNEKEKAIEWLK